MSAEHDARRRKAKNLIRDMERLGYSLSVQAAMCELRRPTLYQIKHRSHLFGVTKRTVEKLTALHTAITEKTT